MKKLIYFITILFLISCSSNKPLPTVSNDVINSTLKVLDASNKNYGNLSILLYKEFRFDFTICVNNQYIGIIGPGTKANLILSEGTHNLIIGIREDEITNYENNPCGPRNLTPYFYINRNLNIVREKNYVFDIQLDPSGFNLGKLKYRVYFNEVSKTFPKLANFRPVINYVDQNIQIKKVPLKSQVNQIKSDKQINLSTAKKECKELGFKEKSEKFGECVMELIK